MRHKQVYAVVFTSKAPFKLGVLIGAGLVASYQIGKKIGRREEQRRWEQIPYHRVAESVLGKRVVS